MPAPTAFHEFLMGVPSSALYTIIALTGGALIMKGTGQDFTVSIAPRPAVVGDALLSGGNGKSLQEAMRNSPLEFAPKIDDVRLRMAAFESAMRSLGEWDAAVRSGDDGRADAARSSLMDMLTSEPKEYPLLPSP